MLERLTTSDLSDVKSAGQWQFVLEALTASALFQPARPHVIDPMPSNQHQFLRHERLQHAHQVQPDRRRAPRTGRGRRRR